MVRLNQQLIQNGLHEVLQSTYQQSHSTETPLLKVQNDRHIWGLVLILLDLSAVFDAIDHTIPLQWLHELGIIDVALDWFNSYLSQRRQSVFINGTRWSYRNMSFGVPQGAALVNFHFYADDTQLYMDFKPNNAESLPPIISNIQNCLIDIKSWMTANMLQLNMDKTEVLVPMNKSLRNPITINKIKIDSIDISNASSIRNVGDILDSVLSFCELHLQIYLVQFIQHKQKPRVSKNWFYQNPYLRFPKSTIATAYCMASQINYWIVFSEVRTMLLGWSSGCMWRLPWLLTILKWN